MTPTQITIDVTEWPTSARKELLDLIEKHSANAAVKVPRLQPWPDQIQEFEPTGWTWDAYYFVVEKLLRKYSAQAGAIMEAIKGGGYVSREKVYELAGYDASRSLKGFTRPVNRFVGDAVEAGLLPEDATDLLVPDYDEDVSGYQRAAGFRVPPEVVALALERKAESEAGAGQD